MTVNISYFAGAGWQFFDANGNPLTGGKIYTYSAGTTTPATTYTSNSGGTPNANPIILDAAGRAPNEIWLTEGSSYKFILKDSTDVQIGSYDNIAGVNDVSTISASIYANLASTSDNAKGDALIGFKQSNASGFLTDAVARTVNTKFQDIINVKDFGAVGDGSADDAGAILAAMNACPVYGTVQFAPGATYKIGSTLTIPKSYLTIDGQGARIVAAANTNFENMMVAVSQERITVKNLYFDANQINRSSTQNIRFCGLTFTSCIDSIMQTCLVENCRPYAGIPAVSFTLGGACLRCKIINCTAVNGATNGVNGTDGFFTSGANNLITGCEAYACTDTGFVVESSNGSGISGCVARECGAGGAITNATDVDKYGNYINGLSIYDCNGGSGVTGFGLSLGNPLGTSIGNLYDSFIANVTIVCTSGGATIGNGPAVNLRQTGTARTARMSFDNIRIVGNANSTQGFLLRGDYISIRNCDAYNLPTSGIQIDTDCTHAFVSGNTITLSANGIVTTGTSSGVITNNYCFLQTGYGVAAFDTSDLMLSFNYVQSPGVGAYYTQAGATTKVIGALYANGDLQTSTATGTVISGSIVNKIPIYDKAGSPLGYLPIYNS